jgi:uncharacterized damage-inducible protein DinB
MTAITKEFKEQSALRLDEYVNKIQLCLEELTEEEIWIRPNDSSNSIGNLIMHVHGNITQYIISSLGGLEDRRDRDKEFEVRGGIDKRKLNDMLYVLISEVKDIIYNLTDNDLLRTRSVQGFNLSGLGIVLHVVEHFSYHTGQIAYWTKCLKDTDLGFYEDFDLNQKNIID